MITKTLIETVFLFYTIVSFYMSLEHLLVITKRNEKYDLRTAFVPAAFFALFWLVHNLL